MPDSPILIFDLDETLLSVNSFPLWARYSLTGTFGGLTLQERVGLAWEAAGILGLRKLKRLPHARAKYRLQHLWAQALAKDAERRAESRLNATLASFLRPNLRPLVALIGGEKYDALLATAAAGVYATPFARTLGFRFVLATESDGETENRGERKRESALAFLQTRGWTDRPRIFFTDHAEDLPLMRACGKVLWFGADSEAARWQAPGTAVIPCLSAAFEDIMAHVTG